MPEVDDEQLRTGTAGRVALVAATLLVATALWWWLWPRQRGEPELAHRVLIVGGTPTDLVTPIAEAGFDADQRTWADIESDVRELTGEFDPEALRDYADEHGYGFVAIMFGADYPWPAGALGSEGPSLAGRAPGSGRGRGAETGEAAVLCVGELCLDGQPRVQFGALPGGLDYAPALRRGEALRLALYEHPDLLRLWEQPTPDQMQQQLQLGKLADARTLLRSTITGYERSTDAWPTRWPADAITHPRAAVRGFPVPGGLAIQRTPLRVVVDEQRKVVVVEHEREVVFVPVPGPSDDEPEAKPLALPLLGNGVLSNNLRWLVAEDVEHARVHRFELQPGSLHDRGTVEHEGFRRADRWNHAELSDTGTLAWATPDGVASELGPLRLQDLLLTDFCWHGPDTLALALFDDSEGLDHALTLLLLARPHVGTGSPELLALSLADALGEHGGYVEPISVHPTSTGGTFVVVRHQTPEGLSVQSLIRVALPSTVLLEPSASVLDPAAIRAVVRPIAALRELDGAVIELLGVLPPVEQLEIAPDGSWAVWRAVGERASIYAARIDDGHLGAPVWLAPPGPPTLEWHQRPRFLADSSAIVFAAEQPWPLGVVPFVRVVPRID